jgi:6-phospho-3-hexuloisomerase
MDGDVRLQLIDELRDVFMTISEPNVATMIDRLASAKKVFTYGVGREGLVLRSFCMRLYHMGLDAHVVGDMTTPHLDAGDLLVTSSGPGYFSTVAALMGVTRRSGGTVLIITANPQAELPRQADDVVVIPGQTMAGGTSERASIQPMGSLYEQVMWLLCDYVVLRLAERLRLTFADMSHRHTNLE